MTVESFISVTNQFRIEKESDWFVDNGANVHVTKDRQIFKEFREFNDFAIQCAKKKIIYLLHFQGVRKCDKSTTFFHSSLLVESPQLLI